MEGLGLLEGMPLVQQPEQGQTLVLVVQVQQGTTQVIIALALAVQGLQMVQQGMQVGLLHTVGVVVAAVVALVVVTPDKMVAPVDIRGLPLTPLAGQPRALTRLLSLPHPLHIKSLHLSLVVVVQVLMPQMEAVVRMV